MTVITFSFSEAYDLKATTAGFSCKIVSNHGNIFRLRYAWTADDIAAVRAGTLCRKQIIIREIKNAWQAFKANLQATSPEYRDGGYTDDGSGNLSKTVTAVDDSISLPKDTVTQADLDASTISQPASPQALSSSSM